MTSCYQRGELVKYGICLVGDVTRVRLERLHRLSNLWNGLLCRQNIHQGPWKLCACVCVNVQAAKRHDTALSHSQSAVQLNNSLCTKCATLSLHFAAGNAHSTARVQRSLTLFLASLSRSLSQRWFLLIMVTKFRRRYTLQCMQAGCIRTAAVNTYSLNIYLISNYVFVNTVNVLNPNHINFLSSLCHINFPHWYCWLCSPNLYT